MLISIQENVPGRNGKEWEEVCVNLGMRDKINLKNHKGFSKRN